MPVIMADRNVEQTGGDGCRWDRIRSSVVVFGRLWL